jgi:polyhydroxyalkanoate synthesis regulator phasin
VAEDNFFVSKKKSSRPQILVIAIVCLLAVISAEVFMILRKNGKEELLPDTGSVDLDDKELADEWLSQIDGSENSTKIALVGKEYIFENDIKRYLSTNGLIAQEDNPDIQNEALDELINQSVALQEGEENGWVDLSSEIFNNPQKDQSARMSALISVQTSFERFMVEGNYIYEGISLYFVNTVPGELAEEKGREYVKNLVHGKISKAYAEAKSGRSLREIGDELKNDLDMPKIDPNYKNDIYIAASSTSKGIDEELKFQGWDKVVSLQEGGFTDILLYEILEEDGFYTFFKLIDIVDTEYESYDAWIESSLGDYNVIKY